MPTPNFLTHLKHSATRPQQRAMRYLESIGQRFCIDFGTDNAEDKARHARVVRRNIKKRLAEIFAAAARREQL